MADANFAHGRQDKTLLTKERTGSRLLKQVDDIKKEEGMKRLHDLEKMSEVVSEQGNPTPKFNLTLCRDHDSHPKIRDQRPFFRSRETQI